MNLGNRFCFILYHSKLMLYLQLLLCFDMITIVYFQMIIRLSIDDVLW